MSHENILGVRAGGAVVGWVRIGRKPEGIFEEDLRPVNAAVGSYWAGTSLGACSESEYPGLAHFTVGLVGLNIPVGFFFQSQTCRS
jgi:hypothetical protein